MASNKRKGGIDDSAATVGASRHNKSTKTNTVNAATNAGNANAATINDNHDDNDDNDHDSKDDGHGHGHSSTGDGHTMVSDRMHPRNIYKDNPPDFAALARSNPEFGQFVTNGELDFKDVNAVRALTTILLARDFRLQWSLPINHLCPPLPQRLNYIHWIADLLGVPFHWPRSSLSSSAPSTIVGLDIGTGASAIFPLLGHTSYGWRFVATEVDPESVASAQANINVNKLTNDIEIRSVPDRQFILTGVLHPDERYDFCVCNPPFFASMNQTGLNPDRATAATESELTCEGGEEQFVSQIIAETALLPTQIKWCTSMVGRKSTLKTLLAILRSPELNVACVQTTTFHQGRQARWGIAWTYDESAAADWKRRNRVTRIEETGGGPPKSAFQFRIKADSAMSLLSNVSSSINKYGTLGNDGEPIGHPESSCRWQPVHDHNTIHDAFAMKGHFMRLRHRSAPPRPPVIPSSSSSSSSTSSTGGVSSSNETVASATAAATTAAAVVAAATAAAVDERRRAAAKALLDDGEEELEVISASDAESRYVAHIPSTPAVAAELAAQHATMTAMTAAIGSTNANGNATTAATSSSTGNSSGPLANDTTLSRSDWYFGITCHIRAIGTMTYSVSLTCIPLSHAPSDEDDTAAKRRFTAFAHWLHNTIKE